MHKNSLAQAIIAASALQKIFSSPKVSPVLKLQNTLAEKSLAIKMKEVNFNG